MSLSKPISEMEPVVTEHKQTHDCAHDLASASSPVTTDAVTDCLYCHSSEHMVEHCPILGAKTCKHCNQKGHLITFCPEFSKTQTCQFCKEVGHSPKFCPLLAAAVCKICSESGHTTSHCKNRRAFNVCRFCKQKGHFFEECPALAKMECKYCHGSGHNIHHCPTLRMKNTAVVGIPVPIQQVCPPPPPNFAMVIPEPIVDAATGSATGAATGAATGSAATGAATGSEPTNTELDPLAWYYQYTIVGPDGNRYIDRNNRDWRDEVEIRAEQSMKALLILDHWESQCTQPDEYAKMLYRHADERLYIADDEHLSLDEIDQNLQILLENQSQEIDALQHRVEAEWQNKNYEDNHQWTAV